MQQNQVSILAIVDDLIPWRGPANQMRISYAKEPRLPFDVAEVDRKLKHYTECLCSILMCFSLLTLFSNISK